MADYHKRYPLTLRFTNDDQAWLDAHAAALGVPVRAVITAAVRDYRARAERGDVLPAPVTAGQRKATAAWRKAADAAREAVRAETAADQTKQV